MEDGDGQQPCESARLVLIPHLYCSCLKIAFSVYQFLIHTHKKQITHLAPCTQHFFQYIEKNVTCADGWIYSLKQV